MKSYLLSVVLVILVVAVSLVCFSQVAKTNESKKNSDQSTLFSDTSSSKPVVVSMIQLIANPEKYDGKSVIVVGFVNIQFEGDSIYLHSEDLKNQLPMNGLWLTLPKEIRKEADKYNGKYVIVEGTFNAEDRGHMDLFSGAIQDIKQFKVWRANK